MFEEYKVTRELRKLKEVSKRDQFLKSLRAELEVYIEKNPVKEKKSFRDRKDAGFLSFTRSFFGTFRFMPKAMAAFLIFLLLGIRGITLAAQNSLPGETFYPVKILTENIRYSLVFSSESKARLNMDLVSERVGEIKQVLENKGSGTNGLDVALSRLNDNARRAADIVQKEKESGKDVSALAKDTHDGIEQYQESLNQAFDDQKSLLETERIELKAKIDIAQKSKDIAGKEALNKRLTEIKMRKKLLETKKTETEKIIKEQKESVLNEMKDSEKKTEYAKDAEKKINELKKEKAELVNEAAGENIIIPIDTLSRFDVLIAKAGSALREKDHVLVEQYLSEVHSIVENIGTLIENAEKPSKQIQDDKDGGDENETDYISGSKESEINSSDYYEDKPSGYYEETKRARDNKENSQVGDND